MVVVYLQLVPYLVVCVAIDFDGSLNSIFYGECFQYPSAYKFGWDRGGMGPIALGVDVPRPTPIQSQ